MVYYVDDANNNLADLSAMEAWKGRKLPGELRNCIFSYLINGLKFLFQVLGILKPITSTIIGFKIPNT